MSTAANGFLRDALLVAVGATAGAVAGAISADARRAPEADGEASVRIAGRVEDLERRFEEMSRRAGRSPRGRAGRAGVIGTAADTGATAGPGVDEAAGGDRGDGGASGTGGDANDSLGGPSGGEGWSRPGDLASGDVPELSPEFVAAVRRAIEEIRGETRGAVEAEAARKVREERDRQVREIDRKVVEYAQRLGIGTDVAATVRAEAVSGLDAVLAAKARGAERVEIEAIERASQRRLRDALGPATYRELRKLEIDAGARQAIAQVCSLAGVDPAQRERIEAMVHDRIEQHADTDVRLRTEEITPAERRSIEDAATEANRMLWDRIRNDVLTSAQRERVPVRIR